MRSNLVRAPAPACKLAAFREEDVADELTVSDMRKMAAEAGLTRLTDEHLEQLLRAANASRARRTTLSGTPLTAADEPAHVFSLKG